METLAEFTERMSNVEKEEERDVGGRNSRHSRAFFNFEGQYCYLDSVWNWFIESKYWWWTSFMVVGEEKATLIADWYGGTIEETFYGEPGTYHFVFKEFEDLMKFVYERHTGEFEKRFAQKTSP